MANPTPTQTLVPPDLDPTSFYFFVLTAVLLVGIVLVLAARTALLRDADPAVPDFKLRTYSLAKTQLAFWTVVIIGTYLFIFIVNPSVVNVLNGTALELLGISMGTSALAGVTGPPAASADRPSVQIVPRPLNPPASPGQLHQTFIDDILSDNQGMNIHRLQMVLWTLVFGGIFIYESYKNRQFPDFSQQNFLLMGISSGTYVWFRRTES
jgi:hypothetical protein